MALPTAPGWNGAGTGSCCRRPPRQRRRCEGAAHARAAGDFALARSLQRTAQAAMAVGPAHVDEAMAAAETMLADAAGVGERSDAERVIGKLLAIRGEIEAARETVRRSIEGNREAGMRVQAAAGAQTVSFVEIRAGDHAAAEQALRDGIAELGRLGAVSYRGTAELMLADLLADQGAARGGGAAVRCRPRGGERRRPRRRHRSRRPAGVPRDTARRASRRGEPRKPRCATRGARSTCTRARRAHTTGRPARSTLAGKRSRGARGGGEGLRDL